MSIAAYIPHRLPVNSPAEHGNIMVSRRKCLPKTARARGRFLLVLPLLALAAGCASYGGTDLASSVPASPPGSPDQTACAAPPLAVQQEGATRASPLRVEVWDESGLHRGSQVVMVSDAGGNPLVTLECDGPFVSFRLLPGAYRVSASLGDQHSADMALRLPPEGMGIMVKLLPPLPAAPAEGQAD
jgi:hypothetical protein